MAKERKNKTNKTKKTTSATKTKKSNKTLNVLKGVLGVVLVAVLVVVGVIGFFEYKKYNKINNIMNNLANQYTSGELSIHFMYIDSQYTGDAIYIKAGETDILVDAGPRRSASTDIYNYLCVNNQFITDGKIEYVIVTHADQDHIAGFAGNNSNPSLFQRFECETIIDFPLSDKDSEVYNDYISERDKEVANGAKRYSALECWNQTNGAKKVYDLSASVKLEILYNYFYENADNDENNYSVCFMLKHGAKNFLFTGDLEEEGEEKLVEYNNLPEVELFKAGHHGSKTSSNDVLLDIIKPKICVVCCVAGSCEYTDNLENMFPTQLFIDRISKHTQKVYVTGLATIQKISGSDPAEYEITGHQALNGNVVVTSSISGVDVNCSNSNDLLKDTAWFNQYRDMPTSWAS